MTGAGTGAGVAVAAGIAAVMVVIYTVRSCCWKVLIVFCYCYYEH